MVTYCMSLHFYTLDHVSHGRKIVWDLVTKFNGKNCPTPCEMHFEENAARFPPHPAAPLGVLTGALVAAPLQPGDWNATWRPETMMIRCPSRQGNLSCINTDWIGWDGSLIQSPKVKHWTICFSCGGWSFRSSSFTIKEQVTSVRNHVIAASTTGLVLDCWVGWLVGWLVGWVGLGWVGLGWVGLGWVGLGWVGLGWVGLGWVGLGWVGLGWVGLGWVGLGWVWFGLVWFGLVWFGLVWFGLVWLVGWLVGWVGWLVGLVSGLAGWLVDFPVVCVSAMETYGDYIQGPAAKKQAMLVAHAIRKTICKAILLCTTFSYRRVLHPSLEKRLGAAHGTCG